MTPIKGMRYSAVVKRSGFPAAVQMFVRFDGQSFRSDNHQIVIPISFEPTNERDAAEHAFRERWAKAARAGE